jgi:hypothetical protein
VDGTEVASGPYPGKHFSENRKIMSDPKYDATDQRAAASHPGAVERVRADRSIVTVLAVVALLVAAGLWFYASDREMVSSDGTVVRTTGSATQQPPAADRTRLPAPSQ